MAFSVKLCRPEPWLQIVNNSLSVICIDLYMLEIFEEKIEHRYWLCDGIQ